MTTKKLLTGAAVLALGVTGSAASHLTFPREARAQSAGTTTEPAQPTSPEQGSKKSAAPQGTKQGGEGTTETPENTAKPDTTTGTRGESGRAGPMPMPDAGATEPEQKNAPDKATQPPDSKNLKSPEGDSSKRDPIPRGSETASPTQRQSPPW
jgi:hypothetical protein